MPESTDGTAPDFKMTLSEALVLASSNDLRRLRERDLVGWCAVVRAHYEDQEGADERDVVQGLLQQIERSAQSGRSPMRPLQALFATMSASIERARRAAGTDRWTAATAALIGTSHISTAR